LELSIAEARSAREGVPKGRPYPVDKRALRAGKTKSKHNHLINNPNNSGEKTPATHSGLEVIVERGAIGNPGVFQWETTRI